VAFALVPGFDARDYFFNEAGALRRATDTARGLH
jgi:hypothetical protein